MKNSNFLILPLMTVALCVQFACKPPADIAVAQSDNGSNTVLAKHSEELSDVGFYADSQGEIRGTADFYFSVWNEGFSKVLLGAGALPASGTVAAEKIPYSGYWYPEVLGGTGMAPPRDPANPNSPLEASALAKYDTALNGGVTKAATWEAQNHHVGQNDPAAGWSGHCNGWSSAASRHRRPFKDVVRNGVTFHPHDVKALLAEVYMSAKYFFLGGNRCEDNGLPGDPTARRDPSIMSGCEDVNPGTFHVAMANWIGRKQYAVVIDESTTYQVWNYPMYKYQTAVSEISQATAIQMLRDTGKTTYRFNDKAVKFASVDTTIYYSAALQYEPYSNVSGNATEKSQRLTYVLELNAASEVIGGEWTGASIQAHPDFIWVPLEPVRGTGTKVFGNPYLDPEEVIKIWSESAGYDPANPPSLLKEPSWIDDWGRFPAYDVVLDGSQTGAVFLGKQTVMSIKRRDALVGNVVVDVSLNGVALTKLNGTGNTDLTFTFDSIPGLNRLEFTWKKDGADADTIRSLRFYAMP